MAGLAIILVAGFDLTSIAGHLPDCDGLHYYRVLHDDAP
jgi:hypothetical protein